MKIFGLNITREKTLSTVPGSRGGWWPVVRESFPGAWQQNAAVNVDTALSFHAVFACQSLIASDISKLRVKLVAQDSDGIWSEVKNPAYSPVLRKPNSFQNRIQFFENWVLSKLQRGNTYVLKQRDGRGVVVKLYVLDPTLVRTLVSESGDVFYELNTDNLTGIVERVTVPAREIIHDRFNCFFHPLVGLSPLFANGLAATHGLSIQDSATLFFQNGSQPGGILTAPGAISDETAARLKTAWETNFGGANRGKLAVVGDGLKYEAMAVNANDAQLIEQLKWSAEVVCSTYHVPPYKIGIGQQPTYNNVQALNTEYYSQCLQVLLEAIELCLDEGLGTGETLGTEFDLDGLLRMDSSSLVASIKDAVGAGVMAPNEGRRKLDLKPTPGGETPYLQEQNWPLKLLAGRELPTRPPTPPDPVPPPPEDSDKAFAAAVEKQWETSLAA